MRSWIWALAIGLVVVIGGAALLIGNLPGRGERRPQIESMTPTPEERELQKIRIAASAGELVEARRGVEGWIVRVNQEVQRLDPKQLKEMTVRFFRELDRTGVPITETSLELRTSSLKDVWGNTLPDVPVFRVGLRRENFQRINWRGIAPDNLERVSDEYWVHDIVKEMERQSASQGSGGGGQQNDQGKGGSGQGS